MKNDCIFKFYKDNILGYRLDDNSTDSYFSAGPCRRNDGRLVFQPISIQKFVLLIYIAIFRHLFDKF